MKKLLAVIASLGLGCLAFIGLQSVEPIIAGDSVPADSPSFEVQVARPRSARPLFGLLPNRIETKLLGGGPPGFDSHSRGADIARVGRHLIELEAEGWELVVQSDTSEKIAPKTHLIFPIILADQQRTLRCSPADRATGYLRVFKRVGSEALDGRMLVELATCVNVATGRTIEWPPAPLILHGSFRGLPRSDQESEGLSN